jgi:endonuclease III related protein
VDRCSHEIAAIRSRIAAFLDLLQRARYLAKKMASHVHLPELPYTKRPLPKNVAAEILSDTSTSEPKLHEYFRTLLAAHGPQHWWPGRTRFEVIVGAILTQNTAWVNVEQALSRLRQKKLLTPAAIETLPPARLARLIRSSGYFRQKTKTLKAFVQFLRTQYAGSLSEMFTAPTELLREQLLGVRGIGPETADSILLYAGNRPVFVVDAYARRMLERHQLAQAKLSYEEIRKFFEANLPQDASLYNEFHALIVRTGKEYCRKENPRCSECPLRPFLPEATQPLL